MSELESLIKRKIKVRKFAINNLGLDEYEINRIASSNEEPNDIQENNILFKTMFNHIQAINDNWYLNLYRPICSNRKALGPVIVFIKKVIRKLIKISMGWYIFPAIDTQNTFNSNAVNSINLMKDAIVSNAENVQKTAKLQKVHEDNRKIDIEKLENKVEELFDKLDKIEKSIEFDKSEQYDEHKHEIQLLVDQNENFRNTIDKLTNNMEELKKLNNKLIIENQYILNRLNVTCDIELLKKAPQIDYFKFENTFRGSREIIKNSQRNYVEYFKTNGGCDILDIGCGRGEFLELMYDNKIAARGIDSYEPFVEYCNDRGFRVESADALTYLNSLEDFSLGGIFMGQVVEHLSSDYILALIKVAYKKLVPGTYFIIETPNPESISTYQFFYVDMGHIKPIHYLTLEYYFKEANYEEVVRYNNEYSKYPFEAKHIEGNGINFAEFNKGIDVINELIFGYRDYTLIARK